MDLGVVPDNGKSWNIRFSNLRWEITKDLDNKYCLHGIVSYKGDPADGVRVTVHNKDCATVKKIIITDYDGRYSIDTRKMASGKYLISALKMDDPRWAKDGDLMDPGVRPEVNPPLTVLLPASISGEKVDIKVLTRKEIFGAKFGSAL